MWASIFVCYQLHTETVLQKTRFLKCQKAVIISISIRLQLNLGETPLVKCRLSILSLCLSFLSTYGCLNLAVNVDNKYMTRQQVEKPYKRLLQTVLFRLTFAIFKKLHKLHRQTNSVQKLDHQKSKPTLTNIRIRFNTVAHPRTLLLSFLLSLSLSFPHIFPLAPSFNV